MPSALEVARSRYRTQQLLANRAARAARRAWARIDPADISGSWSGQLGAAVAAIAALQLEAAAGAAAYHERALSAQGADMDLAGALNPRALAGVASDGRTLAGLLYAPVVDAKQLIGDGLSPWKALDQSGRWLGTLAGQQVRDAGRVADGLATFVDRRTSGYYRMLQTPSCSRCAILAGKFFRANAGFKRHPKCDCVHVPVVEADDSLAFDATAAVKAGQVTGLSAADTRAVLDGADVSQVVNAHRGMSTASVYGRRLQVTSEGVTRRGIAGARLITGNPNAFIAPRGDAGTVVVSTFQRTQRLRNGQVSTQTVRLRGARSPRLMPEAIYQVADSPEEALRLLKRFGYIL